MKTQPGNSDLGRSNGQHGNSLRWMLLLAIAVVAGMMTMQWANGSVVQPPQSPLPVQPGGWENGAASLIGWQQDVPESKRETRPPKSSPQEPSTSPLLRPVGKVPAWVQKGNYLDGDSQTEYVLVQSDAMLKQRESEEMLEERLVVTVRDKVDAMFGAGAGQAIGIDLAYVRKHLIEMHPECKSNGVFVQTFRWKVPEDLRDTVLSEERESFKCYAHLRFDKDFESWVHDKWQNRLVVSRTRQIGLIAFAILSCLGLLFTYFTAEHKTRGFYSRRLQTAGAGFILILCVLFWWLAGQITWL